MKRSGWLLFFFLFLAGVLGMVTTGAALYIRLMYLSAALLISTWVWTQVSLKKLRINRHARSLRASVGDIFEESFELFNPSLLPRPYVEIRNETDLPLAAGSRLLSWIGGGEVRTYVARSWLTQRGTFALGPTTLSSGDPFGFFSVKFTFPATHALLVLPLIITIESFPSLDGLLPGGRAIQRKSQEITAHASGIRDYVHGDALKRIHWQSTAKRNKLMVKEFEQDPQSEFWIFLDAQKIVQSSLPYEYPKIRDSWIFTDRPELQLPPSTLEYGVSLAASLSHYFIKKRLAVGLVTDGRVYTVITAERSERQESKILETLAFVKGEGVKPLSSLVDLQSPQMPSGASALLITSSIQNDVILAVELLLKRKILPVILLLMAQSFGGKEGAEILAGKLEQRGIPVCKVYNNSKFADVLTNFSRQIKKQENRSWHPQ